MGLMQAGFLMALAAVALPVAVHLLSRWQVRRLEIGTMRFLQEVIQDSARRRRIRRWVLLSTRMALVGLLAILFARPFYQDRVGGDGQQERIVLIDRSASMTMPGKSGRLLDDAIAAAVEYVERVGDGAKIRWAWFDGSVEPLPDDAVRPGAPRVVSGETNYFAALRWARDRLASRVLAKAEVVLVTDLQQAGLADKLNAKELAFPRDVPVRIIDVGRPAANNCAIASVTADSPRTPPGREATVQASLCNYGSVAVEEVPIVATAIHGARSIRQKKTLNIPKDQAQTISFNFGKLDAGLWQITVDIDLDDDLSSDNRRLAALEVTDPKSILVVDPGSPDQGIAASGYYLATALKQGTRLHEIGDDESETHNETDPSRQSPTDKLHHLFEVRTLHLDDEGSSSLADARESLIVIADAGSLAVTAIEQLESYVRSGGRLLVLACATIPQAASNQWSVSQLFPGRLLRTQNSATTPFRLVSVAPNTSMLEPFRDPQYGDLGRLAFSSLIKAEVEDAAHVVAHFDGNQPALTLHNVDRGRVAWFLSSADSRSGNWVTSPLYLPLVRQMASELVGLTGEGPIRYRHVGDARATSREQESSDHGASTGGASSDSDVSSHHASLPSRGASLEMLPAFDQPGFELRGGALYVVNMPAGESDPARTEASVLLSHFELTAASDHGLTAKLVDSEKRRELWPWLACALVVLLVFEYALANRTPS